MGYSFRITIDFVRPGKSAEVVGHLEVLRIGQKSPVVLDDRDLGVDLPDWVTGKEPVAKKKMVRSKVPVDIYEMAENAA
jgi:hypothetical protein